MFVAIQTVHKGDTIKETYLDGKGRLQVEKGPGTSVGKVEHGACSKRGTHINGRECFDYGTLVWRMDKEPVSDEQAAQDYKIAEVWEDQPVGDMRDYMVSDFIEDPAEQLLYELFSHSELLEGGGIRALIEHVDNGLVSANDVRRSAGLAPIE